MSRWLGAILLATFTALAASGPAAAQANDLAALDQQFRTLYSQGKYADAAAVGEYVLKITEQAQGPNDPATAAALNNLAVVYSIQGRHEEALKAYGRALEIRETALGPRHPEVASTLNNLSVVYRSQGRYEEALKANGRALAILEKALGSEHPAVAQTLNNLAAVYRAQGRYEEALNAYGRALAIRAKALGPEHPDAAQTLNNLAIVYQDQGRYEEALKAYGRALTILEKALGSEHPVVAQTLHNLAIVYDIQGRYEEALKAYGRALTILEKALGSEHPNVAQILNNLAIVYQDQGRYEEALKAYGRALAIREKALGPQHPDVAQTLNNLGVVYWNQGRYEEALKAYGRAQSIDEKTHGPDHPDVATDLNNLAIVYGFQGRYEEALKAHGRALAIKEKVLGTQHPDVAQTLNNLGVVYWNQGRNEEALKAYGRALAIRETALGPEHSDVAGTLANLANVYQAQGRYEEALKAYGRALAIKENVLGTQHPDVAGTLNNLGLLHLAQRDWTRAMGAWQRSTQILERRTTLGAAGLGQPLVGKGKSEATRSSGYFQGLIKAAWRRQGQAGADTSPMFVKAQWAAASEAAEALAQMAARGAKGDVKLASLVRERQDLLAEWQKRDQARTAAASTAPDKRNKQAEAENVARIGAIEARIGAIDTALKDGFPDYAALASAAVASIGDVQAVLRDDEALLLFFDTDANFKPLPEETFLWVVTKGEVRWLRSDLGTQALTDIVAALRCGLDAALWDDEEAAKRCRGRVTGWPKRDAAENILSETLPFDVARAYALYQVLFGQAEDLIRGKHLLIVPSGPLTQLPFQVLVTAEAKGNDLKAAAWLARSHAITVLPAVASLQALRRVSRPSAASKPMIGFGDPLLDGNPRERPWELRWAAAARDKQACKGLAPQQVAQATRKTRGVAQVTMRDGRADLADLRSLTPLPDTADELCTVAKQLQLSPDDVLLGANATETAIKMLSEQGKLAQYHVLHFATHGTLAGEISGTAEPGLILTPPKEATDTDDGYLSASEVAGLKLDADWVILSACNTAAGGAQGAEALSGLARAFIYAGARALLVSHWAVSSEATVSLITNAVGTISRDKKVGRAEALRRAMLVMIDKGKPHEAHPAYWAPFVVVGEGATR
jgi:tetratricopeptide (TPR) repeat protein/CHAT domain-containing protein